MAKFVIQHDRPGCIACGACAAVTPNHWTMSEVDGKSDLIGSKHTEENGEIVKEELEIEELDGNMEAAESCPVNVIHIHDKEKDQKLI